MATDTVDGGERRARGCEREGSRGERSRQGGSERGSGVSWRRGRRPGRRGGSQAGKEELARLACAPGTQLLRGEGRKTTEGSGGGLGRPGGGSWAGPDGPPGKRQVRCFALLFYFYFSYCFLFYVIVFGFIKNARAFPKIMQLTVATVWNISNSKHFSL